MDNSVSRFCKKCQVETERYVSGDCKPCGRARSVAWGKANPHRKNALCLAWRAANPGHQKAADAAWYAENADHAKATSKAWQTENPDRVKANRSAWAKENTDKIKAIKAVWEKANPEAARIKNQNRRARKMGNGGTLSKGLFSKLFTLQNGKCPACKEKLSDVKPRSPMDHIIALVNGGANEDWNIQILCGPCNGRKCAKHPVDFMRSLGFLL